MIPRIKYSDGILKILDQRLLPDRIHYLGARTAGETAKAIKDMALRGAPLIGCAAAYGYVLALRSSRRAKSWRLLENDLTRASLLLKKSRPTAVALAYAVDRLHGRALSFIKAQSAGGLTGADYKKLFKIIKNEADAVSEEDIRANSMLSDFGAGLLKKGSTVITYCNAGALATAGIGTALGVIRRGFERGKIRRVYACETRPYLQGSRLTMWELMRGKIPCTLITDNMAAHIMKTSTIDAVIVGADRISADGDTANKIGTTGLAIIAKYHKIPFYVAAPVPTIDMTIRSGDKIPIEERSGLEVTMIKKIRIAPKGAGARHPAFDVTPKELITAIITEKGIIKPVNAGNVKRLVKKTAINS